MRYKELKKVVSRDCTYYLNNDLATGRQILVKLDHASRRIVGRYRIGIPQRDAILQAPNPEASLKACNTAWRNLSGEPDRKLQTTSNKDIERRLGDELRRVG